MRVFGYIRVSSEQQNLEQQKHLLLGYAQQQKLLIHKFIEVEASSQKSQKERKIDVLLSSLCKGDFLLVPELSRLGRNMLEVLNIVSFQRGVQRIIKVEFNDVVLSIFFLQARLQQIAIHDRV